MNKSQDELPCELENQFILRLPPEHASTVRKILHSGSADMKDKLKIDLSADKRRAVVEVDNVSLSAKLVDLPCVIGSLKTLDKKTFYKTADISQMLVCTAAKPHQSSLEEPVTSTAHDDEKKKEKSYTWKHGITPPLKNVRKKRFRKVTKKVADVKQVEEINSTEEKNISTENKELSDSPVIPPEDTSPECIESPEVEKEVKRLLCSDAEAASARWEVIAEDETKEIESQGTIPGFPIYPGMSGYKQEYNMPQFGEYSNNSDEDEDEDDEDEDEHEEDEDDDEVENFSEDDLERELQAKFMESGQYEAQEGASSIVMKLQKQIYYAEKKLQEIQKKAQRQKNLLMKVENLMLKNHVQSVLEKLELEEKNKNEQLVFLQEKLKYFLKK